MFTKKQGFKDLPNTMVLTTNDVLEKQKAILFVSHDTDDGMWQFHNGANADIENAMLVALEEIIQYDPSIITLANLPLGWIAWRENAKSQWNREEAKLNF